MADDVVKRLLIKLGIEGSDATAFITKLQDALDRLYATEKAKSAERKTAQQDDLAAMAKQAELAKQQTTISAQQVANLRQQIEAKQTSVQQIQKEIAQEKAKLDVRQATLKIMTSEGALSSTALKTMEKQIALERQRLALQQAQLRATGISNAQRATEGSGAFGLGGVLRQGARGLLGGGAVGTIAAGLLGGVAVVEGVQLLMEGVRELGKALVEATGPAQTLRIEFEKLAADKGADPAALLQKLRDATHGLVGDSQLFQVSTSFMRQGMKLTTDQMTQLIRNTVDLAAASGNSAPVALNALTRAFQTGRPFMLAHVTGLTQMDLKMQAMPRNIDPVIAKTIQFTKFLDAENEAMKKIVIPAATLPDLFTQLHVAQKDFIDGVAEGVLSTGTFGRNIQELSKNLIALLPKIVEMGKELGKDLADAFKWLIDHWPEIKTGFETIVAIELASWAAGAALKIWELVSAVTALKAVNLAGALSSLGLSGFAAVAGKFGGAAVAGEAAGGVATVAATMVPIVAAVIVALGLGYLLYKQQGEEILARRNQSLMDNLARYGSPTGPRQTGTMFGGAGKYARTYDTGGISEQAAGVSAANANLMSFLSPAVGGTEQGGGKVDDVALMEEQKKLAALKSNIAREQAKLEYQIAKEEADAELEILKNKYQRGLIEMDQYVEQEKAIRNKEYQAQLAEIAAERAAEKQAILQKHAEDIDLNPEARKIAATAERLEEQAVDAKFDLAAEQAHAAHLKVLAAMDDKAAADHAAAEKVYQQEIIKLQREGLAEQQSLLEKRFKEGAVGPEDYMAQRRAMIQQETAMVQDELAQELADTAKSEAEKAQIRIKGIEAALAAQKQLTDFGLQEEQIRVQAIENQYTRIKAILQAQQAAAQLGVQQRVPGARGDEVGILQEMLTANRQYIAELTQRLALETNEPALWAKTVEKIKQATDEQIKLNQQLAAARDFAAPLANLMGAIGTALGQAGQTNAEKVLKSMAQSFDEISKMLQQPIWKQNKPLVLPTGPGAVPGVSATPEAQKAKAEDEYTKTLLSNIAQLKTAAGREASDRQAATTKLVNDLNALAAAVEHTTSRMIGPQALPRVQESEPEPVGGLIPGPGATVGSQGVTVPQTTNTTPTTIGSTGAAAGGAQSGGVIQEFVQSLGKGKDAVAGALNDMAKALAAAVSSVGNFIGALRGAQTGAGGALAGGMSGMAMGMQIGGMAGPMGAAIGAAAGGIGGAVMGGIFGAKENQVKHDVKLIQDQLQNIVDQLNQGTISIAQAIANLRQERQTAIGMLSGGKGDKGKKGQPSQLQTVLAQIDQQINQLLQEQKQLIDQMDQSILEMGQGIYWQPIISQLDQIVKQYQQFASAAQGNTEQVAAANEYLTQSLQNYSQTMQQTFLSDQEQAITNALQLLDLERQQAQMTNQYQSQVYGILTQGVTSRQVSGAQTKGAQIEALNQQYSQQQQQMQQEIAVAQYKYQIQQKIFGLASTQVGLEMELVAVQDAQANNTVQGVLALQQAIIAINNALASGNLPSLLTGATSTGAQGLAGILQLLGITVPNVPGLGVGGGINYLAEVPGEWQGLVNFMNQLDPNFTMDVIQAMMTPAGSAQRQALVNLINDPTHGLGTSATAQFGNQYVGQFEQWLSSGAPLPPGTPVPPSQPGGYQEGTTYVPQTGIAQLEQGEAVIPAAMNPWSGVDASGGPSLLAGLTQQSVSNATSTALSESSLNIEQQIYQLVMSRVSAEWSLVQAKIQLLQMEQSGASGQPGVASFEGGLAKIYELRGRYGLGGVRTEYL